MPVVWGYDAQSTDLFCGMVDQNGSGMCFLPRFYLLLSTRPTDMLFIAGAIENGVAQSAKADIMRPS
jgi:hypothetical protein